MTTCSWPIFASQAFRRLLPLHRGTHANARHVGQTRPRKPRRQNAHSGNAVAGARPAARIPAVTSGRPCTSAGTGSCTLRAAKPGSCPQRAGRRGQRSSPLARESEARDIRPRSPRACTRACRAPPDSRGHSPDFSVKRSYMSLNPSCHLACAHARVRARDRRPAGRQVGASGRAGRQLARGGNRSGRGAVRRAAPRGHGLAGSGARLRGMARVRGSGATRWRGRHLLREGGEEAEHL